MVVEKLKAQQPCACAHANLVPKRGVEPLHPCGYMVLNHARLPFRHFGMHSKKV